MANLVVSGDFLIRTNPGLETWVVISVSEEDGSPKPIEFHEPIREHNQPVHFFVSLSVTFALNEIPLRIVEVRPQEPGFYGLRVEAHDPETGTIESIRPAALGIIVDDGMDRGQALACSCGTATVMGTIG